MSEKVQSEHDSVGRVFIVEDNVGSITWILDFLEDRGYEVDIDTNEEAARKRVLKVKDKLIAYDLAIFDVMISVKDIMEIVDLDDDYYAASKDSGVHLCDYTRKHLQISAEQLPIVCLSARTDSELKESLRERDILLFDRADLLSEHSIREFLKTHLPPRPAPSE